MSSSDVIRGLVESRALGIPQTDATRALRQASEDLIQLGQRLLAGYVLTQAFHAAWGNPERMRVFAQEAVEVLLQVADDQTTPPLDAVAALKVLSHQLGMLAGLDLLQIDTSYAIVRNELGQRLAGLGRTSSVSHERAGFLVRGFHLRVNFDGTCSASFPEREVHGTATTFGPDHLELEIESAFLIAIRSGDYSLANDLAKLVPEAFSTPSLVGWRLAITGLLNQADAADLFAAAADEFAKDRYDPTHEGHWSSINVDLWAKYFRARSAVAQIARDPALMRARCEEGLDALTGTESGWVHPQVTCFRILLQAMVRVLSAFDVPSLDDLVEQVRRFGWIGEEDGVSLQTAEFLALTHDGLREVSEAPERAFVSGRLPKAVEVLGRLPLFEDAVRSHVSNAVGERALALILDRQRTWIHKALEEIADERDLHAITLRLLQASHPHYAQIRHGPQEYGKDVVALVEGDQGAELEMYQAKVGDISLTRWREVKPQLEEIYEVDVSPLQLPVRPKARRGFLVFNGHFLPQAEPAVSGWAEEQRSRGHEFEFIHVDAIVRWVVTHRVMGEFRAALEERGIAVGDVSS